LRGLLVSLLLLVVFARLGCDDESLLGVRDDLELRLLDTVAVDRRDQGACIVLGVRRLGVIDFSFNV
jgi:hypothetical protein